MTDIPDDHPRALSLNTRHKIIEGMHNNVVAEAGLIAHGRGEAFDYLLGEKSHDFALTATKAAAALLFLADKPVFSVNGNVAALCKVDIVKFSNSTKIPLEINLFYRRPERVEAIEQLLMSENAKYILGVESEYQTTIEEISHQRRIVDKRGIAIADVVFVPLEDGDRTESLKKLGKKVITIDLNPLSRTSSQADITIIDNVVRVINNLTRYYHDFKSNDEAKQVLNQYNNEIIIKEALEVISNYWKNPL